MYLNVDIDDGDIVTMIEDTVEASVKAEAKTFADQEITRQFETIQKELEGILKQYLKELFVKQYLKELFDKYYLESGERR